MITFILFFVFQPVDVRFIEYMPFDGKMLNCKDWKQTRNHSWLNL